MITPASTALPDGFTAVTGQEVIDESDEQIGQFLDVISYFLIAFAVIAIVVGAFIIFNTFSILVSQRVRESALLRALGASRRQVTRSVLIEAFLMALLGSTLGLLVGGGRARGRAPGDRAPGRDSAGDGQANGHPRSGRCRRQSRARECAYHTLLGSRRSRISRVGRTGTRVGLLT